MSFSPLFPENQENHQPTLQEQLLRDKLYTLFSHAWDFIIKERPESDWKTVKKYCLTKEKLWYKFTDLLQTIGIRFGQYTKHTVVDVDRWGLIHPYTNEEAYHRLKGALEAIGLINSVTVRSSESEGLHLYYFFKEAVPTFKLACSLRWALEQAGFTIKPGHLELFPNTKHFKKHHKGKKREFSYYNGHRLPLQQGSCLLDKDFTPYSNKLEHFFQAAEVSAQNNDLELLSSTFEEADTWFKQTYRSYASKGNNSDYQDWLKNSTRYIAEGWTDNHQTNDLLLTIANVGVKAHHLEGEELAQFIEDTAVAAPGYYPHCRHRHEIKQRSRDVARSAEKYWRAYPSRPRRSFTYQEMVERLEKRSHKPNLNEVKRDRASQRITDTVAHLSETLQALPRTVKTLMKLIRETSKQLFGISVSDKTLKKESNLPLWHPRFLKQQEGNPYATTAAAQEERTEPAQTVCSKKLTEQVMQQESVSELPVVAPPSPPEPHRVPEPVVPQEVLQADPLPTRHQESGATPSCVVRKNDPVSESPETNTSNGCNNRGYTLSLMKGIMCFRVAEMLFQLFQRAYCTAVMDTPGLDLVYQNGEGRTVNGLVYGVKLRKLP